jgi:hypothetical protein
MAEEGKFFGIKKLDRVVPASVGDGPPEGFKAPKAKPRVAPPASPPQPQGGGTKEDGARKS